MKLTLSLRFFPALLPGGALALASVADCRAQGAPQTPPPLPSRPNILFLLSDDHSYPGLGCFGDPNVRTPNIDRLAAEGMKFHNFFCVSPQCVPSRAGFLTGRSAVAARNTRFSTPLPRDEIVFPEVLRGDAGYYTGVAGRIYHLDGPGPTTRYNPVNDLLDSLKLRTFHERMDYVNISKPEDYVARVNEFFDKRPAGKPFFLWMNFTNPHRPWTATLNEPDPDKITVPGYLVDTPATRRGLSKYYGEVNLLDRQVREILDILEKRGLAKNTIVVFAGDNGWSVPHGKGSLHDPGLRVPFIVCWPGVIRPGTESHALISAEDMGPTLLAAAGTSVPKRMTGVNFLPLLRGEKQTPRKYVFAARGQHGGSTPVTTQTQTNAFDLSRCVRNDRYKFIYNCTPWIPYLPMDANNDLGWRELTKANNQGTLSPGHKYTYFSKPRPACELYDLQNDPDELHNIVGRPELANVERELRMALAAKMSADYDYLPLPSFAPTDDQGVALSKRGSSAKAAKAKSK